MAKLLTLAEPGQMDSFEDVQGCPRLDPGEIQRHRPDTTLLLMEDETRISARCSLWWNRTPAYSGHQPGILGHFASSDSGASLILLEHAAERLSERQCTLVIGPMDGNTWNSYRLISERGSEPLFFLEPHNPLRWSMDFQRAGFRPLAHYYSAMTGRLDLVDSRIDRAEHRIQDRGISIRPLRVAEFQEELKRIYGISLASFSKNFLYTPIPWQDFLALYLPFRDYLRPDLIMIAECEGHGVGFILSIPDFAQLDREERINTVIVKTVAVIPGRRYAGLGAVLVARAHRIARESGYQRVIHALMHQDNNSMNISGHYARPFRRYTLYARELNA